MTRFTKLTAVIAVAIATAIFAPSASAYVDQDVSSAGATSQSRPAQTQDLRSPDARDAGLAAEVSPSQDLRSPDTRDAAREGTLARAESAGVSPSRSAPSASDGFEWGAAGVGAAVMLALLSLCGGVAMLIGRSRRRRGYIAKTT